LLQSIGGGDWTGAWARHVSRESEELATGAIRRMLKRKENISGKTVEEDGAVSLFL
jgi:hypothetical protein